MAIKVESAPLERGGRPGAFFSGQVDSSEVAQVDALMDAIDAELRGRGLAGVADVVRTRIFAASRPARDAGSQVRTARLLTGPGVSASSSFIEPGRFPGGDGVAFEGMALAGAGDGSKITEPYEGANHAGLCRYVITGDLVFNTGITSVLATYEDQLAEIGPRVLATIAHAEARTGRRVTPTVITAHVDRTQEPGSGAWLAERLGLPGVPVVIGRCDGFTTPGKLIEVEVDGVLAAAG